MTRKLLIIGGSYFAGRVFNILCSREEDFENHVVNRGSRPLGDLPHIREYRCDRHNIQELANLLPDMEFDAVIDFCAYDRNDILALEEALKSRIRQYVYISTSSVYDPSISWPKTEEDRVLFSIGDGELDRYIAGKAALEEECRAGLEKYGIPFTIFRPAFLYGPYNYAPRENWFIRKIVEGEPVPVPRDCNSRFSFLYVRDLARALQLCVGNPQARNQYFNVAGPEEITYDSFIFTLRQVSGIPFEVKPYTIREILEENIPLPFPLENNDLCDGRKAAAALGLSYTPFQEGMLKTWNAFRKVFQKE